MTPGEALSACECGRACGGGRLLAEAQRATAEATPAHKKRCRPAALADAQAALGPALGALGFTAATLTVWLTPGPDPTSDSWARVAELPLAGGNADGSG